MPYRLERYERSGNSRGSPASGRPRWMRVRCYSYHREVSRLFDDMIHEPWGRVEWRADVDVSENDDRFEIRMDLPGVPEGAIDIHVSQYRLTVSGRRLTGVDASGDTLQFRVRERGYGEFGRAIELSHPVDPERVTHDLKDGVLTVILPKCKGEEGTDG
ncbi:MAG: Hsp20/alpha crystallin family protein [Candidatus Pacebacteria bacterium]|nr:Hsp20/alpha crystallin family protein [Candidatus Paceibacterota bacterium]